MCRPNPITEEDLLPVFAHKRCPITEDDLLPERPNCRSDCTSSPRPCPWVSCRFNLYLDVDKRGFVKLRWTHLEPDQVPASCALDVASEGAFPTLELADLLQLEHVNIRREVDGALNAVRYKLARSGMGKEFKEGL